MGGFGYSGVLEGLKLTAQKEAEEARLKAEQERLKLDQERLKAQSQLEMEKLGQEQRQFNLQHELAVKAADLMKKGKELEFMEREAELSPASIAERERAKLGPQEESQIRVGQAQAIAQGEQQRKTQAEGGGQQRLTQAEGFMYDKRLTQMRLDADERLSRASIASAERIARIRATNTASGSLTYDPSIYLKGMRDVEMSRDDILKQLPKQDALLMIQAGLEEGIIPPSEDQKALIGMFKGVTDAINYMDKFIADLPRTKGWGSATATGTFRTFDKDITTGESQLKGRATPIARVIAQEKGVVSDRDINRVIEGYLPTRFNDTPNNKRIRDGFIKDVISVVKAKLNNLSPIQQQAVLDKLGLTKYEREFIGGGAPDIQILSIEPVRE